jgi:hypothetical protein
VAPSGFSVPTPARPSLVAVCLFLTLFLPLASVDAAHVVGPQVRLADDPTGLQVEGRVEGPFVAWVEVDPDTELRQVVFQELDAVGQPTGAPEALTGAGPGIHLADLVATGEPGVALALLVELTGEQIQGRLSYRLLRAGSPAAGAVELAEIPIRTYSLPVAAADGVRNELVVAWPVPEDYFPDGRPFAFSDVVGRKFRLTTGAVLGPEVAVNGTNVVNEQVPTGVTLGADGSFVVLWDGYNGEGGLGDVFVRRFSSDGAPLTTDIAVVTSDFASTDQENSRMARDAAGRHLVVWEGVGQDERPDDPTATFETAILGRWMGPDLAPLGDEFLINQTQLGDQVRPNVDVAPDGGAVAAWSGPGQGPIEAIYARPVGPAGPTGPEFRVDRSATATLDRFDVDVWLGGAGDLAVVWSQVQPRALQSPPALPARVWSRRFGRTGDGGPPPVPARPGTRPAGLPGYRVWVDVSQRTDPNDPVAGSLESFCIPETACYSGNLPGRSELFVRLIGPRPNGYFWVVLTRFTPARVEVWVEQQATGQVNYYLLEAQGPDDTELPGLTDRTAFQPEG